MELVRDWRKQAFRTAGATALVPAVLLTAAVLLATGTGLGGIGSLGQVTGGPSLPAADAPAPREQARATRASDVALAPAPAVVRSTAAARSASRASGGTATGTTQRRTGKRVGVPARPVTGTPVGRRTPTVTPTSPAAAPPASQPTSPSPTGTGPTQGTTLPTTPRIPVPTSPINPVQQVVDGTKGLGQALPSPLGPTVNRIVDTLQSGAPH